MFASIFLAGTLGAQTIIPLQRGQGGIRSKTVDDYKREQHTDKREQSDSLAYVDNLRRAFNALYADSLGQAETLFNEALKLRPAAEGNHIIKYNLGLVDMARGRNVQAVENLPLSSRTTPTTSMPVWRAPKPTCNLVVPPRHRTMRSKCSTSPNLTASRPSCLNVHALCAQQPAIS